MTLKIASEIIVQVCKSAGANVEWWNYPVTPSSAQLIRRVF
jgi:hypothetical protein